MAIGGKAGMVAVAVGLLAASQSVWAQKPSHDEERARDSDICGYQLMTERERAQYRDRTRHESGQELEQVLKEHRERMQARAKERGVVLSCAKAGEVRQIKGKGASSAADDRTASSLPPSGVARLAASEGRPEER
jgi:hypothetical protein